MTQNSKEWVLINKGFSPAQFISPDGKLMLITNSKWENGAIVETTTEIICLEDILNKKNDKQ